MLTIDNLHDYQKDLVRYILQHKRCALFVDMGLGKTITTLTALTHLDPPFLIIAPKCVAANVWDMEASNWEHTKRFKFSKIIGTEAQRLKAMTADADIYVISRDNLAWLVNNSKIMRKPNAVVIDELSSFKSHSSGRFKAMKVITNLDIDYIIGLTGTPVSNGYMDLWAQMYCIDRGAALGQYITHYRNKYFLPDKTNGNIVYSYKLRNNAEEAIKANIKDFTVHLSANEFINMPETLSQICYAEMPPKARKVYNMFKKNKVLGNISATTAATLLGKLLQFSSGDVYDEEGNVQHIHDAKIELLKELLETRGSNVIIAYMFKHECDKIKELLTSLGLKYSDPSDSDMVRKWNNGEVDCLVSHPASMAHGLNLQKGGHQIIWYSTPWSLELYDQMNARLARQGQTHSVLIQHIVTKDTFDIRVINALQSKRTTQNDLLYALQNLL